MADNRYGDQGGWRGERGRERSNSIFGDDDRDRSRGGGDDRGFFERAGEEMRSWFGGEEGRGGSGGSGGGYQQSHYGSQHGYGGFQGDYSGGGGGGQGGFGGQGDWSGGRQSFSGGQGGRQGSIHDDHYRSWRDRHIAELDRDYEEYCRERQTQFHSDFDSWRQSRQGQSGQAQGDTGLGTSASTGSSGLMAGSGGTTGGGDEGGGGTGSTASSRTSALLGDSDDSASGTGADVGTSDTESAGTGTGRSGGRSRS